MLLAVVALGMAVGTSDVAAAPALTEADWAGVLQVQLGIRNGFLAAMRQGESGSTNHSTFSPSPNFAKRQTTEENLLRELDRVLKDLGPAWSLCLQDARDEALFRAGLLTNLSTAPVAQLSTNWNAAKALFKAWAGTLPTNRLSSLPEAYVHRLATVKSPQGLQPDFARRLESTPLCWQPVDLSGLPPMLRSQRSPDLAGTLTFRVARLVEDDLSPGRFEFASNSEMSARAGATARTLASFLRPLVGEVWSPRRMKRQLGDFYSQRGFAVAEDEERQAKSHQRSLAVEIEFAKEPFKHVIIKGSPRLSGYWIAAPLTDTQALIRVLYQLLPTDDLRRVQNDRAHYLQPITWRQDPPQTNVVMEFTRLPLDEPLGLRSTTNYVNQDLLADQLRHLNGIGWSATLTNTHSDGTNEWAELFVTPLAGLRWRTNAPGNTSDSQTTPEPPRFSESDIWLPDKLVEELADGRDPLSRFLWGAFPPTTKMRLVETNGTVLEKQAMLAAELNKVAAEATIYTAERFADVSLSRRTRRLLKHPPAGDDRARLNHLLLEDAYPQLVRPPAEAITQDKKNHLQFDVEYSPRQPLIYGASYTRMPLRPGESASASVGWQQEAFGDFAYSRDFFAFDALQRRLNFSFTGGSKFEADRLVNGQLVDERRSGGEASGQLDLFRDLGGRWLALDLGAGAWVVEDSQNGQHLSRDTLANVNLGLHLVSLRDGTKSSRTWELAPSLGLYHSDLAGWYFKPGLEGTYHQLLPRLGISDFPEVDVRGHFLWASPGVPAVELPSFGGEDSVRGYRRDAGLGRLVWAVQSEFWLPLRFAGRWEGLDRLIRNRLFLAPFVDLGGVYDSTDGFSGFKAGAGVGLRLRYNQATLRLDWAHALEDTPHERGGSMFYFTVTVRPGI